MTTQLSDSLGGATSQTASRTSSQAWPRELLDLYRTDFDRLARIAQHVVRDRALAEDCVQDVFLAYGCKRPDHVHSKLRSYLATMVRNRAIDLVRREARQGRAIELDEPIQRSAEDAAVGRLVARQSLDAIVSLPKRQREVIDCRLAGLSVDQTAAVLDISGGSVKTHRHRAVVALRLPDDLPAAA